MPNWIFWSFFQLLILPKCVKRTKSAADYFYSKKSWSTFIGLACVWPWMSSRKPDPDSVNKLSGAVYVYACFVLPFSSCCECCHLLVLDSAFFRYDHYQLHQPCLHRRVNISWTAENSAAVWKEEGRKWMCNFLLLKKKKKQKCGWMIGPLMLFEMVGHLSLHAWWQPYWWVCIYNSCQALEGQTHRVWGNKLYEEWKRWKELLIRNLPFINVFIFFML